VIDILILLLKPALLCVEAKQYKYLPLALIAWVVDVFLAHTTWVLIAGWPRQGEWTISHTLERLCVTPGIRQQLFIEIAKEINRVSYTGKHIQSVLKV
jgi:hypothetical protein